MMFDSPNSSTPTNLNPSFHPLSSNLAFPSPHPLSTNTHQDLPNNIVHETLIVGETGAPGSCAPPTSSKPAMRRHTKIHTSQGLRDRRVRLSIGIARQFFDLQDMLGFDKASKTLDWLLSKSNNAIGELAKSKVEESPASSDCHVATGEPDDSTGSSQMKKKKKMTRARKKICCGNPTAMDQSELTRASTSSLAQNNNNNYCFPNLALDWEDSYNPVLPPSSLVVSDMNFSGTGLGAQRECTLLEVPELPTEFP